MEDIVSARRTGSTGPAQPLQRHAVVGLGVWAGASTLSGLGDTVQSFALTWQATGYGARAAGLVATLAVLPRVALMLVGGAVADRYGIRRVMIGCDVAMTVLLGAAAGWLLWRGVDLNAIIVITLLTGIVSAFYLPAAGGFVRLWVTDERLPTVMARIGGLQQLARLVGPSLGAVLVIMVGLAGVTVLNVGSFLIIAVVLILIRPTRQLPAGGAGKPMLGELVAGLRQAVRTPGMPAALGAVALVAGGVLPALYLCLPLLVRHRGWGVAAAGWTESSWIVGTLAVTLLIARRGTHRRTGTMITAGPVAAGLGALILAAAPTVPVAIGGAVLMGVGTAVFTGHLGPLFLSWTPPELTARFQALYGVVQAVPMLVINTPYGVLAAVAGPAVATAAAAGVCLAAALVVLTSRRLRAARRN